MIIIFIITTNHYINHKTSATSNKVSLPITDPFKTQQVDQITIDTDQHQAFQNTTGSLNYIMPTTHPKLYGISKSKDPTTITTLCVYNPNQKQTLRSQEEYDLDTYFKIYASHNTSKKISEIRPILQLPPPRPPPSSMASL